MEPRSNRCLAELPDGDLCLDQAYCFDPELGALVCREHAPIGTLQQLWAGRLYVSLKPAERELEFAGT